MPDPLFRQAADAISQADALLITAGAGMGVDSGLPDFRGGSGFWKAYPVYAALKLKFHEMANPTWFRSDPAMAWGFYGHRLELYRETRPHEGFAILRRWAEARPAGGFVVTSNVDHQFQRAGFDPERVYEVHGTLDRLQCVLECGVGLFPSDGVSIEVDTTTMKAADPLPRCPRCGALARPNVLMFGDGGWDSSLGERQEGRLGTWLQPLADQGGRLVVVECGAGTAIPTIRRVGENLAGQLKAILIRINPREPEVPRGQIGLPVGALEGLRAIDRIINEC